MCKSHHVGASKYLHLNSTEFSHHRGHVFHIFVVYEEETQKKIKIHPLLKTLQKEANKNKSSMVGKNGILNL